MKLSILMLAVFMSNAALASDSDVTNTFDIMQPSREQLGFGKKIPSLNLWITNTLEQYGKTLGGISTPIKKQLKKNGLIKDAVFSTADGYDCRMMVGVVLASGRFDMIVSCENYKDSKIAGEVFKHGHGEW